MILVTGAYGFIGSHFVKYLNSQNITNIIVSDYLTNGLQFTNLNNAKFSSFVYPDHITKSFLLSKRVTAIFHFGAISNTTCWDGELIMKRNYQFTADLIDTCVEARVPISYSSSASVYGNGNGPLNLYAYSKHLIDQYAKTKFYGSFGANQIQGFRYFNVYATDDSEQHKGDQASPYFKFKDQALRYGYIEIFEGSENFYRDFIHVEDVCKIQFEMYKRKTQGIYDLGSGVQKSFLEVATEIAKLHNAKVKVIPFPNYLKGCYQTSTLANMAYFHQSPVQ